MARFIKLTETERITLENGYQNHSRHNFRQRCQALLLSDNGLSCKEIAHFFNTRTRTIYTWMNRWESMGIVGLMILPGRGRKPLLDATNIDLINQVKKKSVNTLEV